MTGRDLREQVYEKLIHFSRRMIGSMGAPTLITRATNDVQQVIQFITFLFTAIIAAPMMFIGGLVLALSQSVKLSGSIACDDTSAAWGFCGIFKADPSLL